MGNWELGIGHRASGIGHRNQNLEAYRSQITNNIMSGRLTAIKWDRACGL
ncbi:hypothetical protein [Microcoleus sp. CAWBG58]|nr:hypothetical protein [Microcoleus sp. CAWBG58]